MSWDRRDMRRGGPRCKFPGHGRGSAAPAGGPRAGADAAFLTAAVDNALARPLAAMRYGGMFRVPDPGARDA
jgi:hypothetical protein